MDDFLVKLGRPLDDAEAETFDLFSQRPSLSDLGMLDAKAKTLDVTIAGRDFEISQAPGILQSNREGGTTGAAIWRTSIRLAEWLALPGNVLFKHGLLDQTKSVLELGTGISGLVPCVLSGRVATVVATDQTYILKTLQENIDTNRPGHAPAVRARKPSPKSSAPRENIRVISLDWEEDDSASLLAAHHFPSGVDMVLACDCIFNYALIDPFVQTCEDLCAVRKRYYLEDSPTPGREQTLCVIVQQLRQPEVFEQWLQRFMERFNVYRLPNDMLPPELSDSSGFAVHVGGLR